MKNKLRYKRIVFTGKPIYGLSRTNSLHPEISEHGGIIGYEFVERLVLQERIDHEWRDIPIESD